MTSSLVLVDSPAPGVRRLTLNRPDQLNAVNADLCEALHHELRAVATDRTCRAAIITGAGRAFCVGLDLNGPGHAPGSDGTDRARDEMNDQEQLSRLVFSLRQVPQPVIAAINGPVAGWGLALALGCDIRFAASGSVFRVAFINMGLSNCDMGTSWLLPRLIGASRAHELMLTGRRFPAEEALTMGLLADVVDGEALLPRALEAAEQIATLSPWGVRLTKQGMWTALEISSELAAIEYEDRQQTMGIFSQAPDEAVAAFLEKRPAQFAD
jgi:enoyl-CoA hydratase